MSWLVAVVVAAATTLAAGLVVVSGNAAGVFWMAVVAIEAALAVGVFYTAVYAHLGPRRLAVLLTLRCAAIVVLMLVLFKPALSVTAGAEEAKARLPILLDRSSSMATMDLSDTSRYAQAVGVLETHRRRIRRHFKPIWYHFGTSVQIAESLDALARLKPVGEGSEGTDISGAIRAASSAYDRTEIPGVLLVTDGNPTVGGGAVAAREAGVPIFTIGVGSDSESVAIRPNIRILSVRTPFEAVKDHITTINVRVRVTGLGEISAEIRLAEDGQDRPAAAQTLKVSKDSQELAVALKYKPDDRQQVASAPKGRGDIRRLKISIAPNPKEVATHDNESELHVLVTEPRIRILYVEGSVRPEYKFLKRVLDTDPNIQFMSLVRWSGQKFSAYGSIGQRRLLRLPTTTEDFALFDVLILGDLDRTYLSGRQLEDVRLRRIREFVEAGGALLMLGGRNSFGPGGYGGTAIEKILPVVVGGRSGGQETTPFLPQLTAQGARHKIFEGIGDFFLPPGGRKPKALAAKLPPLRGCVAVVRANPAAEVLAVHPTRSNAAGPLIILAVRPFVGDGRTAALTADTTWLWYMPMRGMGADSPYQRLWAQLIRWLAGVDAKTKRAAASVLLRADRGYLQVGQAAKLMARVLDEKGRSNDMAGVSCVVRPPAGKGRVQTFPLAYRSDVGLFEYGNFRPRAPGRYRITVTALDRAAGKLIGTDELTLTVAPHSKEMDRLARNDKLLRRIAAMSDGRCAKLFDVGKLIAQLISRGEALAGTGPRITNYRLYNFTLLFVIFVVLLTAEWVLRRNWQLQ
jgi:uncharacterized membrane protein